MQTERVVDNEKATRSQIFWMSKDSEERNTDPLGRTEVEQLLVDL